MNNVTKAAISIIIIICVCLLLFVLNSSQNPDNAVVHNKVLINEWISPDGVHYWYRNTAYGGVMAPRYDNNGELVIDGSRGD